MKTIIIDKNNKFTETNIDKMKLVDIFSLNIRDLRPVFSDLQVATILPRDKAIIINFGFIKAVLSKDNAYILQGNKKDTLEKFTDHLRGIDFHNIETDFYLFLLEKIFEAKREQLDNKINRLRKEANEVLPKIQVKIVDNSFKELLHIKKGVSKMEVRLNEIYQAIKEVLEVESNFEELVSFAGNSEEDNKLEVESILENFIEQLEDNRNSIFRLKEEIEDVEEYADLKLSSRRTSIVSFDLIATLLTLVLAFLGVVVGLFGVNLQIGLEKSHNAFMVLAVSIIFLFFMGSAIFLTYLKKRRII